MRSMFQVGFDREVFTPRHPSMGLSISDLESFWKTNYPTAKADLKPLLTPGASSTPTATSNPARSPTNLAVAPPAVRTGSAPSDGGGSTILWIAGLGLLAGGAYYFLSDRPFGIRKRK